MRVIKVKIKSIIENIDTKEKNVYNLEGIKQDNRIVYYDKEYKNTILLDTEVKLMRENAESRYTLIFDKNKSISIKYELKKYNTFLNIVITTNEIYFNDNSLKINYIQKIEGQATNYNYNLEWEEV